MPIHKRIGINKKENQMKALLIAEKPSLMRTIRDVYQSRRNEIGYEIDFVAQQGHLLGLKMPEEINPSHKRWSLDDLPLEVPHRYKVLSGRGQAIAVKQIKDAIASGNYDFIIHAGDPDQEGEILVRETLAYARNTLPVKRFWSNDTTAPAVFDALTHLQEDSDKDHLADAGFLRQGLDYDYGMNLTRAMTIKSDALIRMGRVKAALLKIICDREEEIENFVPSSTYERAFTYNNMQFVDDSAQFETADALMREMEHIPAFAEVVSCQTKAKVTKAPKLYKLSTLQSDACKVGFTAATTLATLQSLYEKQMVSYPRTGCEYISSNVDVAGIYRSVSPLLGDVFTAHHLSPRSFSEITNDRTYCNDRAIASEGHTGIIPTGQIRGDLSPQEQRLYALIVRRFVAMCMPPKRSEVTSVIAKDENGYRYEHRATNDLDPSFEYVLNPRYNRKEFTFHPQAHDMLNPITFTPKEIAKKCPSRYNDGTLIAYMDNPKGYEDAEGHKVKYKIGTDATRSNIIDECIAGGYFVREGKSITPTGFARAVISQYGDLDVFNIDTSARWESLLEDVRTGETLRTAVETQMANALHENVADIKQRELASLKDYAPARGGAGTSSGGRKAPAASLGNCPCCNGGKIMENSKAYSCSNWNADPKCDLTIWKKSFGTNITKTDVKKLLRGESINKKCVSKAGKEYTADLAFDFTNRKLAFAKDLTTDRER